MGILKVCCKEGLYREDFDRDPASDRRPCCLRRQLHRSPQRLLVQPVQARPWARIQR